MARLKTKGYFFLYLIVLISIPILSLNLFNSDKSDNSLAITPADETPNIDLTLLPQIDYDAINQTWYTSKIEMLIITPEGNEEYYNACIPLRDWKNEKGVKTIIVNDYITNSLYGGGTDIPDMIRNMIKYYYNRENIKWVLLIGDVGIGMYELPIRTVYNRDTVELGEVESVGGNPQVYKPTDFYYADLTGSWNDDEDGNWGESSVYNLNGKDEIDWTPDVYVGRLPANTTNELEIMINKTLKYETDPSIGDWMNRMLLAGAVSDKVGDEPPDGEDESRLTTYIWQHYTYPEMSFKHLYQSTYYIVPPPREDLTDDNFDTYFDSGYSTVMFAGHGNPTSFICDVEGVVYDSTDAGSASNIGAPSLVYADACTTSSYDYDGSIGEILIKKDNAGAIAFIGGLRVTYYLPDDFDFEYLNRANAKLFWYEFFENGAFQPGKALYESKIAYLNSPIFDVPASDISKEWQRKNLLTYNLLGDPEVDIYTKKPGNLINYFSEGVYEGQLIKLTIMDNFSRIVPFARVNLKTADGKYQTEYANADGIVLIQLPKQVNETFNVTITGHNLLPQFFNFTTQTDVMKPELKALLVDPDPPTVSRNVCFNVEAIDTYSGIESIYVFISEDNFDTYNFYRLSNATQENEDVFECILDKLDPGEYSYLIVARDYANNIEIFYSDSYVLSIPIPLINYVLIVIIISIFALVGISAYYNKVSITKHKNLVSRMDDEYSFSQKSDLKAQNGLKASFCPKCGKELRRDQNFCHLCGYNII